MVMCMLKDAQLGKEFWAEGASTASYIVNRIPTRALSADSKTPYQAWYGHPPALQHIRVFGCIAYSHIPKKKRRKLDSKTQKCIFLGYARTTTKIWRLWDPVNRRAFESASVVFDESTLLPTLPNSLCEDIMDGQDTVMDDIPSESTILSPAARLPITLGEEIIDEPIQSTAVARKSLHATSYNDSSARIMRYKHALIIQSKMTQSLSEILLIPSKHSLSTVVPYDAAIEASRSNPISYREALEDVDSERWVDAIHEEYKSLILNNTWESINRNELPPNKGVISCKWVFKRKHNVVDLTTRFKARLCIRGFEQVKDMDYGETFAPVAKFATLRMLLALAAIHDWEIDQMDVETAFLNPQLEEEVYMESPEGYKTPGQVCRLKKALYGLKQAPRAWYKDIDTYLVEVIKFQRSTEDSNLYILANANHRLYLLLWVDDILLFGKALKNVKDKLMAKYRMKDLGPARTFIGLEIDRDRKNRTIHIHQTSYIRSILQTFGMQDCKNLSTPMECKSLSTPTGTKPTTSLMVVDEEKVKWYQSVVGKLMYAMVGTRPDLAFAVSSLGQHNASPNSNHIAAAKRILRYLQHTRTHGLRYSSSSSLALVGYCDSDWASDIETRKSTSRYAFILGNAEKAAYSCFTINKS